MNWRETVINGIAILAAAGCFGFLITHARSCEQERHEMEKEKYRMCIESAPSSCMCDPD